EPDRVSGHLMTGRISPVPAISFHNFPVIPCAIRATKRSAIDHSRANSRTRGPLRQLSPMDPSSEPRSNREAVVPRLISVINSHESVCIPLSQFKPGAMLNSAGQLYRFIHEIKKGDRIAYPLNKSDDLGSSRYSLPSASIADMPMMRSIDSA